MNVQFKHNLEALNRDLRAYQLYTGLSSEETLAKHGGEFGFRLYKRLRALKPDKGEIRAAAMRRLERGQGIQIRPAIRERVYAKRQVRSDINSRQLLFGRGAGAASILRKKKRLNLQALAVEAEINIRERASGFLSVSTVRPRLAKITRARSFSRYGPILSEAALKPSRHSTTLAFEWGGFSAMSEGAAEGLSTPAGAEAMAGAMADTSNNIRAYLDRKLVEGVKRIFR